MNPLSWNRAKNMHPLLAPDILKVWEQGQTEHSLDKALTLLHAVFPATTRDKLAELSIGQRDSHLLALRQLTFGSRLNCFAECPACKEHLEFATRAEDIRLLSEPCEKEYELEIGGTLVKYRMPNSLDLAVIAECRDINTASDLLVKRCILRSVRDGVQVDWSELPSVAKAELAEHMSEQEPQADVILDLHCPACNHQWQTIFDIVSYFWAELNAEARKLLYDIHVLAMAYGWSESDILSMSNTRRQFYLGMVSDV
jgi:hypothetical protein